MKRIPNLFELNEKGLAADKVTEGCEWVMEGFGVPTRQYDGLCCMVLNGRLYRRTVVVAPNPAPQPFIKAQDTIEKTGETIGWTTVDDSPAAEYFREAWQRNQKLPDGTYELCGPKIRGNLELFEINDFVKHGSVKFGDVKRDLASIKSFLEINDIEGIVFHHEDGRMVKVKRLDFGLNRTHAEKIIVEQPDYPQNHFVVELQKRIKILESENDRVKAESISIKAENDELRDALKASQTKTKHESAVKSATGSTKQGPKPKAKPQPKEKPNVPTGT